MYKILEVSPDASLPEIKVAHKLLTRALVTEKLGLRREEIDLKLQMLDLAFNTLSDQEARDAYDAQLATHKTPENIAVPVNTNVVSRRPDSKSLMIAAAIEDTHKMAASIDAGYPTPLTIMATTVNSSASSLGKLLRVFVGLLVLGFVINGALAILGNRRQEHPTSAVSKAEEKVIIQEYYQEHGVRPGSKEEVDLLEIENRRKENERRAAALEQQKKDEAYNQFVEESRRMGDQVSRDLQRAEERARYEAEQKQQQLEQTKRQKEEEGQEAERMRVAEARRRLGLN